MKAVVFTEEPGMGRAYVTSFPDADYAQAHADENECIVFTGTELAREVERLRKWMKSAYDEFATAKSRMVHAQLMLDRLYEYDEEVAS